MPDYLDLEAIWSAPLPHIPNTAAQNEAADRVIDDYTDEERMLSAVIKALYYGAIRLAQITPAHSPQEYYQACIAVLVKEGVPAERLERAIDLLVKVDDAIRSTQ